jgi:hypothetical protein
MKAYLVTINPMVRVVMNDNATEEEIINAAVNKMRNNPSEYLKPANCKEVKEDTECPYNNEDGIVAVNDGVDVTGTSFHGITLYTSVSELESVLGKPLNGDGGYKVRYKWEIKAMRDGREIIATIYDWKEGHIGRDQKIHIHVGGFNRLDESIVKDFILGLLSYNK